jgi:hypothetical protein
MGDEIVEIGVGEHAARALAAAADVDVTQHAVGDVVAQRLDRATELSRGLGRRAQAVGRPSSAARGLRPNWGEVFLAAPHPRKRAQHINVFLMLGGIGKRRERVGLERDSEPTRPPSGRQPKDDASLSRHPFRAMWRLDHWRPPTASADLCPGAPLPVFGVPGRPSCKIGTGEQVISAAARIAVQNFGGAMGRTAFGDNVHNRRLRHESQTGDPTAADAQAGDWSRERLIRMDAEFRKRLERALRCGAETDQRRTLPLRRQ